MTDTPQINVLYDEDAIAERVSSLARQLADANLHRMLVVAVLKGSFIFAADLIRAMHRIGLKPEMEFIHLSSYGAGTTSSGTVTILRDIESDVRDRDVVLVDDILESGRTLAFARDLIAGRGARSVRIAALLDKPVGRVAGIKADFIGFECPDKFVVGYGMDMAHAYRQLPFIGYVVEESKDRSATQEQGG
ncbi:hypoxanthine phosphoribosyltransferase [Breoghania sp. L-A4]|uniref:hypoxanthine phosphoribosyltransferase n=1 Tax=Breoghania sp. L-A4 TaxID=2304600 RepID=UPI000E357FA6|nr:hypoxanthine phosphoribosyltransferase [Breoghania sp. L-A4]AXS38750.1 hypoxanthine phosphoribosyltransferase [Breoghania sp. L-A4]